MVPRTRFFIYPIALCNRFSVVALLPVVETCASWGRILIMEEERAQCK